MADGVGEAAHCGTLDILHADCTGRSAAVRTSWKCTHETRHDDIGEMEV